MIAIGKVNSVVGVVIAIDEAGNRRTLSIGDEIFEGESIVASANATVNIQMLTGDEIVIADGQTWTPTSETFATAEELAIEDQTLSQSDLASVDSIQQALLEGQDPTELGEATAAGAGTPGAVGAAGDGGTSFVSLDRTAAELDPSAGYQTIATTSSLVAPILESQIFNTAAINIPAIIPAIANVVATDNNAIEGETGDNVTFTISRDQDNGADSQVLFTLGDSQGSVLEAEDIETIEITYLGNSVTLRGDEIAAFLANGVELTLSGNTDAIVVLTPVDDILIENRESFTGNIVAVTGGNAVVGNGTDTASFIDEDGQNPDNPREESPVLA
ncbi:MAG: retention module-containing protein, partial [Oceanospirillaceae bacterium]